MEVYYGAIPRGGSRYYKMEGVIRHSSLPRGTQSGPRTFKGSAKSMSIAHRLFEIQEAWILYIRKGDACYDVGFTHKGAEPCR